MNFLKFSCHTLPVFLKKWLLGIMNSLPAATCFSERSFNGLNLNDNEHFKSLSEPGFVFRTVI